LNCTGPWTILAEAYNVSSLCFAVALEPGLYIEYQSVAELNPPFWGCVGPYPPGTTNGTHTVTLGGASVTPNLVDNRLGGCNFRYRR
jgi:hypothetical protein